MKLSLSWISDFVDLRGITVEDLVHRLTMSTCEVEEYFDTLPFLKDLIVAEVRQCERLPDSDHLSRCTVFDGKTQRSVVCGASNVRSGIFVAFAPAGSELPAADGKLRIETRKIRGVLSEGMICSARELRLDPVLGDNGGIIILNELEAQYLGATPDPAKKKKKVMLKAGMPLDEIFPYNDTVIDIDNKSITHRPDLWSHFGFAREIAAIFKKKLKQDPVSVALKQAKQIKTHASLPEKTIRIVGDAALTYQGIYCDGIHVMQSPVWMKLRLAAIGQKSINNVVDASNYVMYEIGQPNHCFDASRLKSDTIICAASKEKTSFAALDEKTYEIPAGCIFIYDGSVKLQSAVALAGVIGGERSSILPDTQSIFIESATFPRDRIRKALASGAPRTESARRFEKGQDPVKAQAAIYRIVELLMLTNPALRCGALTEAWTVSKKPRKNRISITLEFLRSRLGFALKAEQFIDIMHRLQFEVKQKGKGFEVLVPSFRSYFDVQIPEDLIEEIGRIYGYDNIKPVPAPSVIEQPVPDRRRIFERMLKERMIRQSGYDETMNYSFASAEENALAGGSGIRLRNPVQSDRNEMRRSLIPGLLAQAATNQDRFDRVSMFELGRVFIPSGKKGVLPDEPIRLSFVHLQDRSDVRDPRVKGPENAAENVLAVFLDHRSRMEAVLKSSGIPFSLKKTEPTEAAALPYLHPKCQVAFVSGSQTLGWIGLCHPEFSRRAGIKRPICVVGDFDFEALFQLWNANRRRNTYRPPSVHPASEFELTLMLDEHTSTAAPITVIQSSGFSELQSVELITIYHGSPIPAGSMAVSYRVRLQSDTGGISGERQQEILNSAVSSLQKAGFPLRGET
jgi:phenylalanyl-tRNA synthetase beta chain